MKVEIRNNSVTLDGYVNVVDRESRVLPSPRGVFKEVIVPHAFEKALNATNNVDLLFNHDENRKLGSTLEGNLQLYEDNVGLRAIATITDQEVIQKAMNNELQGWSFGFIATNDEWTESDGIQKRYVKDMELKEVSILDCTPAYVATSVEMRGENKSFIEFRSDEKTTTSVINHDEIQKRNDILSIILELLEVNQ